jgi:hypothetical protein
MPQIRRVALHKSSEIPAPAQEVWALLTDWAGMLRWSRSARRRGPLGLLVKCELIGEARQVPRVRRMTLDSGLVVEEELFYQNDESRRIYYRKNDAFGTIGYLASSYVDEGDATRSTLHISCWFDTDADPEGAATRFETIYGGIFDGFKEHFS